MPPSLPHMRARMFANRVRIERPTRGRDQIAGGTSQTDSPDLNVDVACSIQQEKDDPRAQDDQPGRGNASYARIYFPTDVLLKHEDKIIDDRKSPPTVYVVQEYLDPGGKGVYWQARCLCARR
jgi:hypothetical protein